MEQILNAFPKINGDENYYLIKTCNGKYYDDYLKNDRVGFYPLNKKFKQRMLFITDFKPEDVVLIPSTRNKKLSIGKIISNCFKEDEKFYRTVSWMKEIDIKEMQVMHKYLHKDKVLINLNEIKPEIDRNLYPYFYKNSAYHFVLKVNQNDNIQCMSLYGLYDLILNEQLHQDLTVKITVKSQGLIEFITYSVEVIVIIIKVFHLIHLLRKVKPLNKKDDNFIHHYQDMVKKYYDYEVHKLHLDSPRMNERLIELIEFEEKKRK